MTIEASLRRALPTRLDGNTTLFFHASWTARLRTRGSHGLPCYSSGVAAARA
jgi:hypothetical protein